MMGLSGIKATICGMAAFNITEESKVQVDNISPKNHLHRVLGQERGVTDGFLPRRLV